MQECVKDGVYCCKCKCFTDNNSNCGFMYDPDSNSMAKLLYPPTWLTVLESVSGLNILM